MGPDTARPRGDPLQRRQHPPAIRPRSRPVEEASHEYVLQAEVAEEQLPGDMQRAGDARHGPLGAREAGGQRLANMAEPEAEGGCQIAPRHPTVRLLLQRVQAAAGQQVQPTPAAPERGQWREGVR